MHRIALMAVALTVGGSIFGVACSCGSTPPVPCTTRADCPADQQCVQGYCSGDAVDGGPDSGPVLPTGCSPTRADNAARDTDCDGISDADEYAIGYGGADGGAAARTDPCNPDTDGDGVSDGVEVGRTLRLVATCTTFAADEDARTKTNPTVADTDGDGLSDGAEDTNRNGRVDPGEGSPLELDSDCDGYGDGQEAASAAGCRTDPSKLDTDGDGLTDGVEGGLVPPGADVTGCGSYDAGVVFDVESSTKTNPCVADSDGDGIMDGAEDTNHNGRVDPGEMSPTDAGDGSGPAQEVCTDAKLKPIALRKSGPADVQEALVTGFSEVTTLRGDGGVELGLAFFDPSTQVAGLVLTKTPAGDATAEEAFGRARLETVGNVGNALVQTYTSWDGFPGSRATYELTASGDVKTRLNALARAYLGASVTGLLSGTGTTAGPFKVQASYVVRSAQRAAVVVALVPSTGASEGALFSVDDVAGGTALAQAADGTGTQCEVFSATINQKVDFLWVVDDSGSMRSSQTAVANAGSLFGTRLSSAGLDWRVGAVTTGWYSAGYSVWDGSVRDFTTNAATMTTWFSSGSGTSFGTSGSGNERGFSGTLNYLRKLGPTVPCTSCGSVRGDALLNIIYLSDTREQTDVGEGATTAGYLAALGPLLPTQRVIHHGIVCPEGTTCDDGELVENPGKYHLAVRQTGGVLADIEVFNDSTQTQAQQATIDAIVAAAVGASGHQLQRPPIAPTIKVALELGGARGAACTVADVPRSRTNGWDIDSATRRISFFGDCIPRQTGVKAAVSYKYWVEQSADPNGDPCGGECAGEFTCDPNAKQCVCAPNCGGTCAAGFTCDMGNCTCQPGLN